MLYVPELATRFGTTPQRYWLDCAAKWDRRAETGEFLPRREALIESDWCRGRAGQKPVHEREIKRLAAT